MNKKYILIAGKKRSGKDTVAKMLKENIPNSEIFAFADAMKQILSQVFNISIEELNYAKDNGRFKAYWKYKRPIFLLIDFRHTLQQFGSEIMKPIFGRDVWVKALTERAENSNADTIIVSDWRFLIERIEGSETIRVYRDGLDTSDTHSSENELNKIPTNYFLDNTSSLVYLEKQVIELSKELKGKK